MISLYSNEDIMSWLASCWLFMIIRGSVCFWSWSLWHWGVARLESQQLLVLMNLQDEPNGYFIGFISEPGPLPNCRNEFAVFCWFTCWSVDRAWLSVIWLAKTKSSNHDTLGKWVFSIDWLLRGKNCCSWLLLNYAGRSCLINVSDGLWWLQGFEVTILQLSVLQVLDRGAPHRSMMAMNTLDGDARLFFHDSAWLERIKVTVGLKRISVQSL